MDAIRLPAVGRKDRNGNQYYFTCPTLPCTIDLSKVVIFIHPCVRDGEDVADIVIKPHKEDNAEDPAT